MNSVQKMLLFATVVDEGSFTAAAKVLGVTKSNVSKQLSALETQYQVRLLNRTTRSLAMTEAGALLYEKCEALRELVDQAESSLEHHRDEPTGVLRLTAPLGIGEQYIAPRLAEFCLAHPKVELNVSLSDSVESSIPIQFDIAIRAGRLDVQDLIVRKLFDIELVVVCSPETAESIKLKTPEELTNVDWITYSPIGAQQSLTFTRRRKKQTVKLKGRVSTNNGSVIRSMVTDGPFVSVLPMFWVRDAIENNELVSVLNGWELGAVPVFALSANRDYVPQKVRAFLDFFSPSR